MTQKMTLHRALSELKTLDKRINNGVDNLNLVALKKGDKFTLPVTEDDFNSKAKGDLESVEALIERRHTLKKALIMANATNTVTVNGKTMTIAEAIDYKSVIEYKEREYRKLNRMYQDILGKFEVESRKNEEKLENFILSMTGKDSSKLSPTELENFTKTFNKTNEVKIVDPIGLKEKIDKLREEIDNFTSEIDAVLSEANATVTIEV